MTYRILYGMPWRASHGEQEAVRDVAHSPPQARDGAQAVQVVLGTAAGAGRGSGRWPGLYSAVSTRHLHLGGLIEDAAGDQEQEHQKPETRSKSSGRTGPRTRAKSSGRAWPGCRVIS